jgi:hypothetical protein
MFISCIETISIVGGILGCFNCENNNQEIQVLICNYLNIGVLNTKIIYLQATTS